jgi:1,4-alpha-glucan branching enzyme
LSDNQILYDKSPITDFDIYLFKQGNHLHLYEKLGSHLLVDGCFFAVWAPNATRVSVIGEFNRWNPKSHQLKVREDESGIWEGFIPGIKQGALYKYHIVSQYRNYEVDKGDPFAFYWEAPPRTASVVRDLNYDWQDNEWLEKRHKSNSLNSPISIYEVHLGSWRRVPEENNRFLSYQETAKYLAEYVKDMGFTHVEFLPLMEHPFYGSWGYQILGYFAPTSRYGKPQDLMYLIDYLHQQGIGVILDWVPSHFPSDEYGLVYFDGSHLYEHADPKKGFHPHWQSYIFNYGRNEVRAFLLSIAHFWLEKYHADGLRTDAVASMLYLDYGRKEGEWIPNQYGGRENLEAIDFMRRLNESVYNKHPGIQMIAEESTAWPMVTRPTYTGGLGFGMKWNMGWMHDTLDYFANDPVYRKYHQDQLTFSIWYTFSENFLLPLSHDEVVHGKGSLFGKMAGDEGQKFANLRLLFGYMYTHPGKKLLFMGAEIGQWREWNHDESIEWHALEYSSHQGIQRWVKDLNLFYQNEPALHDLDFDQNGFEWIDFNDSDKSIISFIRKSSTFNEIVLVICNLTPVPQHNYRIGVPVAGSWQEILNSDAKVYGGSGQGNLGRVETEPFPAHGKQQSISLTLPPLGIIIFKSR